MKLVFRRVDLENTVGKVKLLVTSQHFLCFPHCFSKIFFSESCCKEFKSQSRDRLWLLINASIFNFSASFPQTSTVFTCLLFKSPFPTVFSTCLTNFLPFQKNMELSSANSVSLVYNTCHLGKD